METYGLGSMPVICAGLSGSEFGADQFDPDHMAMAAPA
jgi:hypothetical protein